MRPLHSPARSGAALTLGAALLLTAASEGILPGTHAQEAGTPGLLGALGCGACHAGTPPPAMSAPLPMADPTLDPARIYSFLLRPPAPAPGQPRMPDFRLSEAEALALARTIAAGEPGSSGADTRSFSEAETSQPDATAEAGLRLRSAFACEGCHGTPRPGTGPPLHDIADRVRTDWLRNFLAAPHPVRPFGWRPGSGARMPDFNLSAAEIDSLIRGLAGAGNARDEPPPDPLSHRLAGNTLTLMRERWGCMGCHAWNGEGGRIGPDLARAGTRLSPAHIRRMLETPERSTPWMPKPLLTSRDRDRILALLVSSREGPPSPADLPPLEHEAAASSMTNDAGAALYASHCAACHGAEGRGDGWNAGFLDTTPARHADSAAMSLRTDDTLYDGIHAGGRVLGGSAEMPAFGGSLEPQQIRALVGHIRTLCRCSGPAWSVDGRVVR